MLKQVLLDNPLLVRHVRSNLRPPRAGYLAGIIVSLSSLLMFAGYKAGGLGSSGFFCFFFRDSKFRLKFSLTHSVE